MASEYQTVYKEFLSQKKAIPEELKWKLQCIVDHIHDCSKPLKQLTLPQQEEAKQIGKMSKEALKIVFVSIAKSIVLPQFYQALDRNCHIRTQGYFEKWEKAFIVTEPQNIYFKKKNQKLRFPVFGLQIKLKQQGRKIELGYKGKKKATIKFSSETAASTILNNFLELVHDQESAYKKEMMKRIISMNSNSVQQEYASYSMKKNASIWIHKKQPKIHAEIYVHCPETQIGNLLYFYLNHSFWNQNLKKEELLKENGKIYAKRVYKPLSFLITQRTTLTQIFIESLDESSYLLLQSSTTSISNKSKAVLGSIQTSIVCQIIDKFSVTLRFQCYWKGKGFCNEGDNRKMLLEMWKDILHFENSFHQPKKQRMKNDKFLILPESKKEDHFKSLYQSNFDPIENQLTDNFQTIRNDDEKDEIFFDFNGTEEKESLESDMSNQKYQIEPMMKKVRINEHVLKFKALRPKKYEDKISPQYITMLRNRQYEKSYQQFKFDFDNLAQFADHDPWYCLPELLQKKQYIVTQNKQLHFINEELIQGQKDTLKFVIKQIGANIISGKSVMNVSLPVDIFEARSLLERAAASYGCAPSYLRPVGNSDPLTQMKSVFPFIASVPTLELVLQKPFNPILGETFQGYLQGIPIYYEQISHHPPISSYYMKCKQYTMYGNLVAFINMGLNTGVGGNSGPMHIIMENGSHFECYFPPGQISGLIYGQRKFRSFGKGYVIEKKHKLFCEFSIEKQSKGIYEREEKRKMRPGDIIGGIFQVTDEFIKTTCEPAAMKKFSGIKKDSIVKKHCDISGVWFEHIFIDGKCINENVKSYPIEYHENLLPSDSNYRLDVMTHRIGDLKKSQKEKEVLEQIQRADRRLREKMERIKR